MEHPFAGAGLGPGEPIPLLYNQDRACRDQAIAAGLQETAQVAFSVVDAVISRQPFINYALLIGNQAMPLAEGLKEVLLSCQAHPLDLLDVRNTLIAERNPDFWSGLSVVPFALFIACDALALLRSEMAH